MYPFIMIHDFMPNFIKEYSRGGTTTNYKRNFCQYLLNLAISDSLGNERHPLVKCTKSSGIEQYLKNVLKQRHPEENHEPKLLITVDEIVPYFIEKCSENFLQIHPCFVNYFLHLLIRDAYNGLRIAVPSNRLSICKIESFLERALAKLKNSLDATVCHMNMSYYFKQCREINLDFVKEKYAKNFNEHLNKLISSILQYPETSTPKQLDDMFFKMQIFIITNYCIGCPKNNVLLKQCRQSLNSILSKGDIQKYVLRKKYHRLEYLQKLGATAAGMLIFNSHSAECDKEHIRNIFADLKMSQSNTKESLEEGIKRSINLTKLGYNKLQELISINIEGKSVYFLQPIAQVREINKFVILFEGYRYNLLQLKEVFEKTQYLVEVAQKKFNCIVEKVNEILKFRSAIESERIFPHFVYLSEIWSSLVLYLNHLVEINKIKDCLNELINEKIENKFNKLLEELSASDNYQRLPINYTFQELIDYSSKHEGHQIVFGIKPFIKDYCALTIALTNGFLIPATLAKKLCEDSEIHFGFANIDFAKYAEKNFKDFIKDFRLAIATSNDLLLLFQLDEEVMQQDFDLIHQSKAKTKTLETQTEQILANNFLTSQRITSTWNVWDFHRECIKLADIRKKQTKSAQTKLSFGLRNAQNQAYSSIKCNKET